MQQWKKSTNFWRKHIRNFNAEIGLAVFLSLLFSSKALVTPYNTIRIIDGSVDSEWASDELRAVGPGTHPWDSTKNVIERLYLTWDSLNLYLGLVGHTEPHNGMHIAIDIDPGEGSGENRFDFSTYTFCRQNCRSIEPGWGAEFMYASDGMDKGKLYSLNSKDHTEVEVQARTGSWSLGLKGYEVSISWNILYGDGKGKVPIGAELAVVAIMGNGEGTYASPETAPVWVKGSYQEGSGRLEFDSSYHIIVDGNDDGIPDNRISGGGRVHADGDPYDWMRDDVRKVDPWGDDQDPGYATRDILAFYEVELPSRLVFRVDLGELWEEDDSHYIDLYIAVDYRPGGSTGLPNGITGESPFPWDRCLLVKSGDVEDAKLWANPNSRELEKIRAVSFSPEHDMIEASVDLPEDFTPGSKVNFYVFTVRDGYTEVSDDLIAHSDLLSGTCKVAFLHHGNQSMTSTDVLKGPARGYSGYDEILEVHDAFGVKVNLHLSGLLQTVAAWWKPEFNEWLAEGAQEGRYDIITSAYAQHIMPFVDDTMNAWALNREGELIRHFYGYEPRVAWVPERVWFTSGPGVHDDIRDNWDRAGIEAVVLDDDPHGLQLQPGTQRHEIWEAEEPAGLKVFFRDAAFSGWMHFDSDIHQNIIPYFASFANATPQEQYILYADDWEMAAGVAGWDEYFPNAFRIYQETIRYIGSHPWIESVRLSDLLDSVQTAGSFDITEGTYWLIGGTEGYGGPGHQWYTEWAEWIPFANGGQGAPAYGGSSGNLKSYEEIWEYTLNSLLGAHTGGVNPYADRLVEVGWHTMLANLYETAWHDWEGKISGWEHKHSSHIKNGNIFAKGAEWIKNLPSQSEAFLEDVDYDGYTELVIRNSRVMGVFDRIGGCARWIFDSEGHVVVGNDMAYWNNASFYYGGEWHDDAGDYSDGCDGTSWGNQTGALTDNWINGHDYERDPYEIRIEQGEGEIVTAVLRAPGVEKRVSLSAGAQYFDVRYESGSGYMITGFSPDVLSLIEEGQTRLRRLYSPQSYVGWINEKDGVVGAIIYKNGGAAQGGSWDRILCKVEQLIISPLDHFFLYAGPGSQAILDSLANFVEVGEETTKPFEYSFRLYSITPNPSNGGVELSYEIPVDSRVLLEVYNSIGQLITTLINGHKEAGRHIVYWSWRDESGRVKPRGVYFFRLTCGRITKTVKGVMLR